MGFRYGDELIVWTQRALAAALILQALLVTAGVGAGTRAIGTTANPNQLGYWALLCMAVYLVMNNGKRLGAWDLFVLLVGAYIGSRSLSKAVMISSVVL